MKTPVKVRKPYHWLWTDLVRAWETAWADVQQHIWTTEEEAERRFQELAPGWTVFMYTADHDDNAVLWFAYTDAYGRKSIEHWVHVRTAEDPVFTLMWRKPKTAKFRSEIMKED